jgi:magnesium transporter
VAYSLTQVHEPTPEQFAAALVDAGLTWPFDDLLRRHRHPGFRAVEGTVGLVLHPVHFDDRPDAAHVIQVAMILGPDRGVIARWKGDGLDDALDETFESRHDLVHALLESVYDTDTEAMIALEERVDDCELEVLTAEGQGTTAQSIYHLEHELLTVRRSVTPMVGVIDRLGRKVGDAGREELEAWRERYARLVTQMEDIDNLLSSVLGVNLTLVSVRQNEDMRKIAAWGAIGIAPTALAGIWGMNFRHMPELGWGVGYPLALATIFGVCIGLYLYFRKVGWL